MEMYYPPARMRILRERLLFLATRRHGLSIEEARSVVEAHVDGDGGLAAEDALLEIRRRTVAATKDSPSQNSARLMSADGIRMLQALYQGKNQLKGLTS